MACYYDTNGKNCTQERLLEQVKELESNWSAIDAKQRHSSVTAIREFNNGKLNVRMLWSGKVSDHIEKNYFPSDYPLFVVVVLNNMTPSGSEGEIWKQEPSESTFYNRNKANNCYEDILLRYANCYYNEEGEFFTEDNRLISHMPADFKLLEEKIAKEKSIPKTVIDDEMVW
jgi:hypothetical protein